MPQIFAGEATPAVEMSQGVAVVPRTLDLDAAGAALPRWAVNSTGTVQAGRFWPKRTPREQRQLNTSSLGASALPCCRWLRCSVLRGRFPGQFARDNSEHWNGLLRCRLPPFGQE